MVDKKRAFFNEKANHISEAVGDTA